MNGLNKAERQAHLRNTHTDNVSLRDWWTAIKGIGRLFHRRPKPIPTVDQSWHKIGYTDDGREIQRNELTQQYRTIPSNSPTMNYRSNNQEDDQS